jgi:hypothetical protein
MEIIGNININFTVFSDSPKHLKIADFSDWVYSENQPAYIKVTTPGSSKTKAFSFSKKQINIFNSNNLGLSCLTANCKDEEYIDLPDGIYTIQLLSSYEDLNRTKFYLKTDRFDIEYSKVMIKYGLDFDSKDFLYYMVEIKGILEVAKSHAMLGDFVKAQRFFEEAKKMLNKYVECVNCF